MSNDNSFGGMSQPGGGGLPSGVEGDILRHNGSAYASLNYLTPYEWLKALAMPLSGMGNIGFDLTHGAAVRGGIIVFSTSVGSGSNTEDEFGFRLTITSGATIGNQGFLQYSDLTQRRYNIASLTKFSIDSVSDVRMWLVFYSEGITTAIASDDPAGHLIGLRFSTTVPDTNFIMAVKDGSTLNTHDTGVAGATGTFYLLTLVDNSVPEVRLVLLDDAFAELDDHTFTSNLPGESENLLWGWGVETREAATKAFNHYYTAMNNHRTGPG